MDFQSGKLLAVCKLLIEKSNLSRDDVMSLITSSKNTECVGSVSNDIMSMIMASEGTGNEKIFTSKMKYLGESPKDGRLKYRFQIRKATKIHKLLDSVDSDKYLSWEMQNGSYIIDIIHKYPTSYELNKWTEISFSFSEYANHICTYFRKNEIK